jgi:hypothetical protein
LKESTYPATSYVGVDSGDTSFYMVTGQTHTVMSPTNTTIQMLLSRRLDVSALLFMTLV